MRCVVRKRRFIFRLKQILALVLVAYLVVGPGTVAWGQGGPGGGAAGGPGVKRGAGPGQAGRPAVPPGGAPGAAKPGVSAVEPSEEILPGGQALSRAVIPDKYILGPGDGLSLNLWGEYTEQQIVRVTPDGKISLPTIGDLRVKGLTLTRAEALIDTEVRKYYRNVKSGLSLTSLRVFEVLVLGEVARPGTYLATPVKRVSEVIAQAGGVLPGGSQRYIQIRREGKISESADLLRFLKQGDESMNPFLKDGDVIFVPPMGDQRVVVQVSEVSTGGPTGTTGGAGGGGAATESAVPSIIEIKPGERLSSVISELGGTNPWWDLESVTIQRASESPEGTMRIPVDLRRFFYENDQSQNPVLQGGDEIYIPALIKRVFVAGEVKLPGAYSYIPGRSADAYVMQAGGPAPFADLSRSFIMRADGTALRYDGSVEMNSGDSIVVLEMMFKTFQDYFALVGTLTGVVVSMVGFYAIFTNFGR